MRIITFIVLLVASTTTAFAQPNLAPYQPQGWSAPIVVSTTTGTTMDASTLRSTDTLYIDWAVANFGNVSTTSFSTRLFVDNVAKNTWAAGVLAPGFYTYFQDYNLGSLAAGQHSIVIVADVFNQNVESNEVDNRYEKTINVVVLTRPVSPTNLRGLFISDNAILQWTDNSNNEDGFTIARRLGTVGNYTPHHTYPANPYAEAVWADENLTYGNVYCYYVWAFNAAGNSELGTNEVCGTALAAPNQTFPGDGAQIGTHNVTLQWNAAAGANGYYVRVGSVCGTSDLIPESFTTLQSYPLSAVPNGTYQWDVRASNSVYPGSSLPSNCRSFTVNVPELPTATWEVVSIPVEIA